jgi:IclR family pca regulon transcriptional regulator
MAAFLEPAQTEDVLRRCEVVALTQYSLRNKDDIREALKVVRRQGYALVDQEVEVGVRSISVPVLNKQGVPVAAVTTLTNIATISKKQLVDEILPVMQRIVPQLPTGAL